MWVVHNKHVEVLYLCRLASKDFRDWRVQPRTSQELRSSGSGKIATHRWLNSPEERSSQLLRGCTLKSRKFLLARRYKYITRLRAWCVRPTFQNFSLLGAKKSLPLNTTRFAVKIFPPKNLVYIFKKVLSSLRYCST
jgi:hypothetical protein